MSFEYLIFAAAAAVGLYMALNIGANDLANAMGTSVGAKSLTMTQAIVIAGICDFLGAVLAGGHVTDTVRKGMIDTEIFVSSPNVLLLGMFCALLSAGIWVHLATTYGWPVSTSHAIVGAVIGFGIIAGGWGCVSWGKTLQIAASWIISPFAGAVLAATIFLVIDKAVLDNVKPEKAIVRVAPVLIFVVFTILVLSFLYKGLKNLHLDFGFKSALLIALSTGLFFSFAGAWFVRRISTSVRRRRSLKRKFGVVEGVFAYLQIITAGYIAFAHGANDVANAVGPLAAIFSIIKTKAVMMKVPVPMWMLAFGGIGIVIGVATFGARVIKTIGQKITEMTPSRGFAADFGAATTILICSRMGMPVSTTHTIVGAVVGVGAVRGMSALNLNILKSIFSSWIFTLPFTAILSMIFFKLGMMLEVFG